MDKARLTEPDPCLSITPFLWSFRWMTLDGDISNTEIPNPLIYFSAWIVNMTVSIPDVTVGVLALQGAFSEHIQLLRKAAESLKRRSAVKDLKWSFIEVRTPKELEACDALILPGGESTTMSLVAARSGLLEPLRDFVK